MNNQIRTRDGQPFDFEDGLKIKNKDVAGPDGASLFGCKLKLEDISETNLQTFLYVLKQFIDAPTAPDQAASDSTDRSANTKFVQTLITNLKDGVDSSLDTLKKLALAIGNDASFSQTVATALAAKLAITDYQKALAITAGAGAAVDSITADFTPAITQLVNGMEFHVRISGPITVVNPTFSPNYSNIAFKTIVKGNNEALDLKDLPYTGYWARFKFDTALDKWILMNPATGLLTRFATDVEAVAGVITDKSISPASLKAVINTLINAAPAALDTLKELADALANDPNFATTMTNLIGTKAPINNPTFTGWVNGITKAMVGLGNVDNLATATSADMVSTMITQKTIFDNWTKFSHLGATQPSDAAELATFTYDAINDRISNSTNSNTYIGFVSPNAYGDYQYEVELSSSNADDDIIGIVLAFATVTGVQYTLTAQRFLNSNTKSFSVVYNAGMSDTVILADNFAGMTVNNYKTGATPGTGWSTVKTKLKAVRSGDVIVVSTTDFNGTEYLNSHQITIDLNSQAYLAKFKTSAQVGIFCQSQPDCTWNIIQAPWHVTNKFMTPFNLKMALDYFQTKLDQRYVLKT